MDSKRLYETHKFLEKHHGKYVFTIKRKGRSIKEAFRIFVCECGYVYSKYNYDGRMFSATSADEGSEWRNAIRNALMPEDRNKLDSIADPLPRTLEPNYWISCYRSRNYK